MTDLEIIEQQRLLPGEDPDDLIRQAKERWNPIKTFCLFSGGNDSSVVAHRCRDHYDELLFIDTGTAVPGVEQFVNEFAEWIGKPVTIIRSGYAFRHLILGSTLWWRRYDAQDILGIDEFKKRDQELGQVGGKWGEPPYGFPGKGLHYMAYSRLKERRIEEMLAITKNDHPRSAAVLFVSGIRRDESQRRKSRSPLTEKGSAKFVNPLIDWTSFQMLRYRREHKIPQSDPAALAHRSMECQCGAYADAEAERKMIQSLWPKWWEDTIAPLEAEAQRLGIRWCRWGGYDLEGNQAAGSGAMPDNALCADNCQTRMRLVA